MLAFPRRGRVLEAIPISFFSSNYRLREQNLLVGELDNSKLRDKARLELEEGSYNLYREKFFSGDFVLERLGNVVARATKPSVFRQRFEVELQNRNLVLRKLSIWNRRFGLFDGENQLGTIYPVGMFTYRANIDLPREWPIADRTFLYWLAFIMWKRQNDTA